MQCRWDDRPGQLRLENNDTLGQWSASSGNTTFVLHTRRATKLMLSKRDSRALRLVGAGLFSRGSAPAIEKAVMGVTLEFGSAEDRDDFARRVRNVTAAVKDEKKVALTEDNKKDGAGDDAKEGASYSLRPQRQITAGQRKTEIAQLKALLVDELHVLTGEEADRTLAEVQASTGIPATEQQRGPLSVFGTLSELLVDESTHRLRPVTEALAAQVFHRVPELAVVYQACVKDRDGERMFWEALVHKALFFSNTFLEAELKTARASISDAAMGPSSSDVAAADDPMVRMDNTEKDATIDSTGHRDAATQLMSQWNAQSTATVNGLASREGEGTAARILSHTAMPDLVDDAHHKSHQQADDETGLRSRFIASKRQSFALKSVSHAPWEAETCVATSLSTGGAPAATRRVGQGEESVNRNGSAGSASGKQRDVLALARSVYSSAPNARKKALDALREASTSAAAKQWGVPVSRVVARTLSIREELPSKRKRREA